MVVLVTGATGLIGRALVKQLLKKNYTVHYLTTASHKIKQAPNCKGFIWNPAQHYLDPAALESVDAIIHLAGASIAQRWTPQYKNKILRSRLDTTQTLFFALEHHKHQIKQLIAASGTAIYPSSSTTIYNENFQPQPNGFLSEVVLQWEKQSNLLHKLGIRVCMLRTGVVFAVDGGVLPVLVRPIRWGVGAVMGNGNQIQSWIHLQDIVGMYMYALANQWEGVYNAVAPESISNTKLTKLIAAVLKRPLWLPAIPKLVMKLVLGDRHELLFTNTQISCQKALDAGYVFQFPTAKAALKNCLVSASSPKNHFSLPSIYFPLRTIRKIY